jgi:hypothetical protein
MNKMEKTVKVERISEGLEKGVLHGWVDVIIASDRREDYVLTVPPLDQSEAVLFKDKPKKVIFEGFKHEITRDCRGVPYKVIIDKVVLQKNHESRCNSCCQDHISYFVRASDQEM